MKCSNCSSTLSTEFKYCPNCGNKVEAECQAMAEGFDKLFVTEHNQLVPYSDYCVESDEILLEDEGPMQRNYEMPDAKTEELYTTGMGRRQQVKERPVRSKKEKYEAIKEQYSEGPMQRNYEMPDAKTKEVYTTGMGTMQQDMKGSDEILKEIIVMFETGQVDDETTDTKTAGVHESRFKTGQVDDETTDTKTAEVHEARFKTGQVDDETTVSKTAEVHEARFKTGQVDDETTDTKTAEVHESRFNKIQSLFYQTKALVTRKVKEPVMHSIYEGRLKATLEDLKERLNQCDTAVVKFGVSGGSGTGKSSFIKLILQGNDNKADGIDIKTGYGDTTMDVKKYENPKNKHFTISDMPGFGTAEMPKCKFLHLVDLPEYDYFFIFIGKVFSEDDIWLANILLEIGVPYCFVRSKLDLYLQTEEVKKKYLFQMNAVRALRKRFSATMQKHVALKEAKLFLISNKPKVCPMDIYKLIRELTDILPYGKSEAVMSFLPVFSPDVIEMKVKSLKNRSLLFKILFLFKLFLGFSSYEYMKREIERYARVLGLTEEYVENVPGLEHALCYHKSLPPEKDKCWKEDSYLDTNLETLKEDALKVFRYCKGNAE